MEQKYINGDIVMYNDKVRIVKEIRDNKHFDLRELETNLRVCYIPTDEISGVKITPVILEKNGWKKEDKGYSFKDLIFIYKDKFGGWAVEIGDEFILTISFIHQLQHLLFGLGLGNRLEV